MAHIAEDDLEAYALERPCPIESIEEHLLVCEHCQTVLNSVDEHIVVMRLALRDEAGSTADSLLTKSAGH